ncbi:hypothetical protein [Methylocystis sp. SC2]|uniref:hypothetical protein n=1 Tax=Methylocystis sp. (strain SC2) TaxID=187303 RepID=UPI0005A5061F|nr:hypothetical protein [Methylocystis sp. SC2]
MTRSATSEQRAGRAALQKCLADLLNGVSPMDAMKRDEIEFGRRPLDLDERPWFASNVWHDGVVAIDDAAREVRIVAIAAKAPGAGALRKLVAGIESEGMTPVIVEAMTDGMLTILSKWNWKRSIVPVGGAFEEQWRPPR